MRTLSLQTWTVGLKSLVLHPLRSLLTVLGIFIGVASVIWLMAIGEGISRKAQEQIVNLGAENIIVRSIKPTGEALEDNSFFFQYGVLRRDYERVLRTIPTIERALPIRELRRRFRNAHHEIEGRLVGCTPEYLDVMRLQVDRGRFFTDAELRSSANVCVLSAEVAQQLFPLVNPIGMAVGAHEEYFVVVGVLKPRAPTAGLGGSLAAQDFSSDVYIPVTTLWNRIGDRIFTMRGGSREGEVLELSQITLCVDHVDNVMRTADLIQETLSSHHDVEDYTIVVPLELLEQARTTRLMFVVFMGSIAAISLLVGGIGIMNIMMATVTERTREIGIRRALGARKRDIRRQFLAETVVLSVGGGVTGIVGGLLCRPLTGAIRTALTSAAPNLMKALPEVVSQVEPEVAPWSIVLAFGISVGVGIVFGMYPAIRAANLDPIEALRR